MVKKVQSPPFYEVGAREPHYLADPLSIFPIVTLSFAFLAHGLGVMWTPKAFPNPVTEEFVTGFTQLNARIDGGHSFAIGGGEGSL
jgi:hypothetical protein